MTPATDQYGTFRQRLDDLLRSLSTEERAEAMLLTRSESEHLYELSVARFPVTRWQGLDWENCAYLAQYAFADQADPEDILLARAVREHASMESLVVITWGNLTIPSMALPARSVARHADEVVAASDDIWLFAIEDNILIEYWHHDRLTIARVPETATP
ncbi:hypothetical protein FH609_021975 [Streptomyces sp. 3MP-14]|uniref:Uncharacterized protein n=1 Tax=Streptomyces mimosae TaxID=2586635 RepID=A0A5N6A5D3_9ACTN|nr:MULTISPECIES: hypothetical protein [Streptomyces]KAB8163452.1 hypothetical protein FH607_019390 [Streptomyces mimosae]KAB8174729.1 hypothetical protein FH609_021975 [Streptomyces sp. 3MP-14]